MSLICTMILYLIDVLDSMNWLVEFWYVAIELDFLLHARNSGEYYYSRPSELVLPRREWLRLAQVLFEQLAQAECSCFERHAVSLRRECLAQASSRRKLGVLWSRSRPGEGFRFFFWAKSDLAQVRESCPGESLQSAPVADLAQVTSPSLSETVV